MNMSDHVKKLLEKKAIRTIAKIQTLLDRKKNIGNAKEWASMTKRRDIEKQLSKQLARLNEINAKLRKESEDEL